MKVVRLHPQTGICLHDEPKPVPAANEVLLQITAVGLCGSDLHWLQDGGIGDSQLEQPLVLGHEFAALTPDSQRVAVEPAISCGQCEWCQQGHPNLCPTVIFAGHGGQDGALREYMAWPRSNLFSLPDQISDIEGAMLEPLGVAIHAAALGKLQPGMTVGVFGCGPIGLLIIQLARAAGAAQIIATDTLSHRVEAARVYGASQAFSAHEQLEVGAIQRTTGGRGVDVAFEAAGEQEAVDAAVASLKPGGSLILVGIPANDSTMFQASIARRKGLTIKLVRRMKHTYPQAIALVAEGAIDVASLVTHRYPLERAAEAFATARRREGLKVIVEG